MILEMRAPARVTSLSRLEKPVGKGLERLYEICVGRSGSSVMPPILAHPGTTAADTRSPQV